MSNSVIIAKDGSQQTVAESASSDENGVVKIPISQNGHYVVKVEGPGHVAAKENIDVECDIAMCRDCSPGLLVPVSPLLEPGQVRLTMSWGERPLDLDVYAQQKNINTEESCTTYYGKKTECEGISLDLDNYNGGNNGVETITFHDVENQQDSVYMLFVHHYGSTRDTEEFCSSGVHLTITDRHVTSSMSMDAQRFNGEEHWVAGCVRMVGSSYEFAPVNVFLNSKPDEEIPNLCLEKFGHEVSTEASYAWYNPKSWLG